ncbi:hypothetical protein RIVM261_015380 [Rivularia sp. IAM M-261]|nr:hypothetical protein RIVM261_015380 [Rivularia sp. IAM M-261]
MKRLSIAGLGAVVLITSVTFNSQIPLVTNIWQSGVAIAQSSQKGQIQLRLEAAKKIIQQVQGKQQVSWQALQGRVNVQPGDVLRYTVTGANNGNKGVKNLVVKQPVPKGMIFILNSATVEGGKDTKITYSIDGGRNFLEKPTVQVTLPSGKVETRPAPASAYTHLRWKFAPEVPVKAMVKGTYQVQVQ